MWLVGDVIRRYIDILIIIINLPYSTCIRGFLAAASLLLCSFLMFLIFGLVFVIFLQYIANVTHTIFEVVQKKSRSREYKNYLIIYVIKNVERASTARPRARESRDFHVRGTDYGIRSE